MNPSPIKVLIADDEVAVLEIMAKTIARHYQVIKAQDGKEAWEKIKSEIPDVIILDLNMPKMDGWEVLMQLRQNPPTKRWQSVIIVSAESELHSIKRSAHLKADHYLTKPCQIESILKSIRLMLSLAPLRET